jgi:hypothetical protein
VRLYVEEQHVVNSNEVDSFIETKEKNGFTVKDISYYVVDEKVKKLVIIEKWNKSIS